MTSKADTKIKQMIEDDQVKSKIQSWIKKGSLKYIQRDSRYDQCLEWVSKRNINNTGYVVMTIDGISGICLHRMCLSDYLGRILKFNLEAGHKCNNRKCCNPTHLYEASDYDQQRDIILEKIKEHGPVEFKRGQTRFNDQQIALIKEKSYYKPITQKHSDVVKELNEMGIEISFSFYSRITTGVFKSEIRSDLNRKSKKKAVLAEELKRPIIQMRFQGNSLKKTAEHFNVSFNQVRDLLHNENNRSLVEDVLTDVRKNCL